MKKELPPAAIAGIAIVALILIIGGGMMFVNRATGTSEDPELAKKQLEVEVSKRPGGSTTNTSPVPPPGASPGRESEMEARQRASSGN